MKSHIIVLNTRSNLIFTHFNQDKKKHFEGEWFCSEMCSERAELRFVYKLKKKKKEKKY